MIEYLQADNHTLVSRCDGILEWHYHSDKTYTDPFNEITLDVIVLAWDGTSWKLPAFWKTETVWGVRFAAPVQGTYEIRTVCSDTSNGSLHDVRHTLNVDKAFHSHAPMLSKDPKRGCLTDQDGTPFFWLSDTWWMALSRRLTYPEAFHTLLDKRKSQGFNVIQLVAGLFPDMGSFDPRGANESGLAWQAGYDTINPDYFDHADDRIFEIVKAGLVPCIVGSWGYYLLEMGKEKMQRHWRNLIARWGALPVVWCIAAEATMPYYLSDTHTQDTRRLKEGWSRLAHYISQLDPWHRLLSIHPVDMGTEEINNPCILDINLLQASHFAYQSVAKGTQLLQRARQVFPAQIPIMDEINYEEILRGNHAAMQRLSFWSALLNGSKGYGYGANGIWQINTPDEPFGASPHGASWGDTPWKDALQYEGATQISTSKKWIETLPWWHLKPMRETIRSLVESDPKAPYMAGVDDTLRIIYLYEMIAPWDPPRYILTRLCSCALYRVDFYNPAQNKLSLTTHVTTANDGTLSLPKPPTMEDWVIVMYLEESRKADISAHPFSQLLKKLKNRLISVL